MAFAETANLAVKLTLGGNFTSQMAKARSSLRGFDKESRAFKAGAQIGTGIKRSAFIAVAALGTLAGALAVAVKEGQDAANVQKIYANAISNSKKVTADNVKALNAQQTALMNLAGVDDELIKTEQTRLIQMGLSGKATAALTPLILDASKATGKDLLTVTVAAGKAANGNATALQRLGIVVDKTKFKINPLAETIRVLNQRFGGTTQALSGSFDTRLNALRENLKNIREDVGIKLLPALTRIVDVVGTKLVPAFGKFVDRILPDINSGLNDFADALSNGGAENAIRGITDALGPMIDLVKIAAAPVKAIVQAFLSLPKEVQTVLVGAFAVNKLTGGLVTNAAGGIIEAIGKGLLGGIRAPLVNVQGGVVNVGGAGAGGGLGQIAGVAGVSTLGALTAVAGAVAVSLIATNAFGEKNNGLAQQGLSPQAIADIKFATSSPADQQQAIKHGFGPTGSSRNNLGTVSTKTAGDLAEAASQLRNASHDIGRVLTPKQAKSVLKTGAQHDKETSAAINSLKSKQSADIEHMRGTIGDKLAADQAAVTASGSRVVGAAESGASRIVAAIHGIPAPVVHVSATTVNRTTTITKRYGTPSGSRNSNSTASGTQGNGGP